MMIKASNLLSRITFIVLSVFLLALPSCSNDETRVGSQMDSYTIADSTGDWGFPSPYLRYSRGPGYTRMQFIFETLVWKDATGFIPQLAKEWEYIEEENAYLFKLHDNVTWHDGEKFTADDVVFTIDYIKTHPDPFVTLVGPSGVKETIAVDDYTIKLYLEQPYASFLHDIAGTMVILPRHIWQDVEDPKSLTGPEAVIGTGPYTLADYSKEHGTYLYKANDSYYLGKPAVKEIRFVKIAAEMNPAALKDSSVNSASVPAEVAEDMEDAGFTVITAPPSWNAKLTINHQREPLSYKDFRQALACAIDRESLVEIVLRGEGIAGSPGIMPPTSIWYNPDTPQYEYDPEKARQLIEGLGYSLDGDYYAKDGQPLRLNLIAAADYKDLGQFITQQLEEIGIDIDFQTLEAKTVDSRVGAWEFDLSIYGHGGLYEPSILKRVIIGDGFNSARYTANEELSSLLEAQSSEMDTEERKKLIFEVQEVYAEDLPALTLYYPESYWAHDGKIDLYYTKDGIASGVPIPLNRMCFVK